MIELNTVSIIQSNKPGIPCPYLVNIILLTSESCVLFELSDCWYNDWIVFCVATAAVVLAFSKFWGLIFDDQTVYYQISH